MEIDIWSDIACPWCFIGITRFQRVLDGFEHRDEVSVRLHSFQLDPALPETFDGSEAEYLAASKGMASEQVEQMFERVRAAGAVEGLVLDFEAMKVANSRRAHRLLHAARIEDRSGAMAHALKQALLRAHFSEGLSISEPEVLVRLAVEHGMDETAATLATGDGPEAEKLDELVAADMALAGQLGIQSVPFFVLGNKFGVPGAQPDEVFARALQQAWDELHPHIQPLAVPGLKGVEASGQVCGPDGCD